MADIFDKEKRSEVMSKVKSGDTAPEMALRRALHKAGMRGYRVRAKLPGSPDIAYTRYRVAIFVDGCFWHGCPHCYSLPQTNRAFWKAKLEENRERDRRATEKLEDMGWRVIRFWEHEVEKDPDGCVRIVGEIIGKEGTGPVDRETAGVVAESRAEFILTRRADSTTNGSPECPPETKRVPDRIDRP